MRQQGFDSVAVVRTLDMRYKGQSYEINLPEECAKEFDKIHEKRYGYSHAGRETQVVTARVQAIGKTRQADRPDLAAASEQPRFASIHVPNGWKIREAAGSHLILERVS